MFAALTVASFFSLKFREDKNKNLFAEYFVTALVAIFLLPLFLKSLGNNSLQEYLGEANKDTYKFLDLFSYVVIVAIAGGQLIQKILKSFDINIDKDLKEITNKQSEIEEVQNKLSVGVASLSFGANNTDKDTIKNALIKLNELNRFSLKEEFSSNISENDIKLMLNSGLIVSSKSSDLKKTYRITKAGIEYLNS